MIWCVDDDYTIRDIEVYTLRSTGFEAKGFSCAKDLYASLENEIPDLIVLDIMLPEEDGTEILKKLRSLPKYKDIPVIMATAKGSEMDKIQALDLGADDYLAKPFGVMEMVARVKAVLRRSQKEEKHILKSGDISLNENERSAYVSGKKLELTYKEFELIRLFLKNPEKVFSRDKLMNEVWGTDYLGESRTVDMHIKTLRHKLGSAGARIKTVIGVGYKLEEENE